MTPAQGTTSGIETGNGHDGHTVGTVPTRTRGWTLQVGTERHCGDTIVTLYTPGHPGVEPAELTPAQARELGCLLIESAGPAAGNRCR